MINNFQKITEEIFLEFEQKIKKINKLHDLYNLKSEFISKKGHINVKLISKIDFKSLNSQQRIDIGKSIHQLKEKLNQKLQAKQLLIKNTNNIENLKLTKENLYHPSFLLGKGNFHPLTLIMNDIYDFFNSLNFEIKYCNEIEYEKYNFANLNIDNTHIARDYDDTFYIETKKSESEKLLLRTHTTNVTSRYLEKYSNRNIIKVVSIGNVYRRDTIDATHTPQFIQIDGFILSENANIGMLKTFLTNFSKYLFGENVKLKLRPSFFPFTCPSYEVDISCFKCNQTGCLLCKKTGWIEILGSGLLHENVLKAAKIKNKKLNGIAFGIGLERLAMLKYGISDIRLFYENDIRFLK